MRILWTSMFAPSESPAHHEEIIFNMLDDDQPLVSSHLNFSISRSPMSFSVTSRNECVLFVAIFSFLPGVNRRELSVFFIATRRIYRSLDKLSRCCYSQFQLQVFSLSFGAVQRDGERGLHLRPVHLAGEVDLQLIVVHWKTEQKKQQQLSTRNLQNMRNSFVAYDLSHWPLNGMVARVLVYIWALRGLRTLLMS